MDIAYFYRMAHRFSTVRLAFFCAAFLLLAQGAWAQKGELEEDPQDIWQMSGVVIKKDTLSNGITGVHIYDPISGRGTTSDFYGYFSLPVVNGDSLIISAIGYQKQSFLVPEDQDRDFSILVELEEDTLMLPEVTIFPYPTEMAFKRAVLALNLPYEDRYGTIRANLENTLLLAQMEAFHMGAAANHRWFMEQQHNYNNQRFQPFTNPLTNPFAWAQFIRSLKKE